MKITSHGFWRHSKEFLEAADSVRPPPTSEHERYRTKPSLVAYYLVGHSIELSLKSFLLAKNYPISELRKRKFGHDLSNILAECRKRKLGREVKLTKNEIAAIMFLDKTYKEKRFEYFEYGGYNFPEYFYIRDVANKLVNNLARYAMNSPFNKAKQAGTS